MKELSGIRQLGIDAEYRVMDALNGHGISTRHATQEEDLSGWDLEVSLRGYTVRVDLTISRDRLQKKQISEPCRNGLVIAVMVDPGWSPEELFRETLRQVICSLPDGVKRDLLQELTKRA